ncbi:MAG: histidinol-phosphatase [Massilibacteroides sp.]|nr:histidinol-phosphatase [Massilibacteroides sp.]MDD3062716.1 histidinol-phosphatase [Massilibacteroides sp.]MDD4114146.1 histidinol-phosphatase [Massilibacteroides sp.]MDD4660479.1 histidinol-phosphatase [Massilibacteroides sp.]
MYLSNYHSHSLFCDGRSTPEDFVKFALSAGFKAYGFSSHSPLPFETNWNMSASDLTAYLEHTAYLKEKYKGRIELYTSLEIDYLDETYNPSISYFREMPLDYRIGSVHLIPVARKLVETNMVSIDGPFEAFAKAVEIHFGGDVKRLVRRYYGSSMRMVEAGDIDIVGHMDKIYMNGQQCAGFSLDSDWYTALVKDYIHLIAEKNLMVEINTKNLIRRQHTYPHRMFFSLLKELDIPVMVNSDCHFPHLVNDGRKEAFELLHAYGFKSTRELIGGKWTDVPL